MGNRPSVAKRARRRAGARLYLAAVGAGDWPDRLSEPTHSVISVDGWKAGLTWIEAWARCGGWIVLDHSAHSDVCSGAGSDPGKVLWCESRDADDVWAMLAELRGRSETQQILVVRRAPQRADLDSPEIAALQRLCWEYRATLVVVIQSP